MIDWIAVSIFHNVCMLVQFLKWYLQADACSDWKFVDFVFFIMSHFYSNSKMYLLVLYNPREMEWCRDHTISFFIKIPSHIVSLTARSWKICGIQTRVLTFNTSIWINKEMLVVRLKSVTVTEIFSGISKASGSATNALSLQAFPSPGFDSIKLFCLIPTKSITDFHFSTLA